VRYLGIIQRKSKTFLGQQELQLLAKEEGEYVWKATQGQLSSDLLSRFGLGAMVIAEITQGGQLQRVEDAAPHLVAILQGFIRFTDNLRNQSSEVDLWRNALDLQAKAVSDREQELMDWENRLALFQQELGIQQSPAGENAFAGENSTRPDPAELSKLNAVLEDKEQQLVVMRDELEVLKTKVQEQDQQGQTLQTSNAALQEELEKAHERYEQLTWAQQNQSAGVSEGVLASVGSKLGSLQKILQAQQLHHQDHHQSFYARLQDLDTTLGDLRAQAQQVAELQQTHQAETLRLAELYREIQSQNQETFAQSLQWEQTEGVFQAYGQHYEKYQQFLKSLADLYTQQRQASVLLEEQVGPGSDAGAMLSPELGRKRQDLRRDAKQVEDQEHELMEIEQQVQSLQDRLQLMQKEGAAADDIEEVRDDLDFQQQRCQILREGLLPQQQRLRQAKGELQQQIDLFLKDAGMAPMTSPSSDILNPLVHQMAECVGQLSQYLETQEKELSSWWQQVQEQQEQHLQQKGLWQDLTNQLTDQESSYQDQWRAYQDQQQQLQEKFQAIQQTQEVLLQQRNDLVTVQESLKGNLEQPLQMLQGLLEDELKVEVP
jgi:chromosome segregation ATPase